MINVAYTDVVNVLLTILGLFAGIFVFFIGVTKNKLSSKALFFRELDRPAKKVEEIIHGI